MGHTGQFLPLGTLTVGVVEDAAAGPDKLSQKPAFKCYSPKQVKRNNIYNDTEAELIPAFKFPWEISKALKKEKAA